MSQIHVKLVSYSALDNRICVESSKVLERQNIEKYILDDNSIYHLQAHAGGNHYGYGVVLNDTCIILTPYAFPLSRLSYFDLKEILKDLVVTCEKVLSTDMESLVDTVSMLGPGSKELEYHVAYTKNSLYNQWAKL